MGEEKAMAVEDSVEEVMGEEVTEGEGRGMGVEGRVGEAMSQTSHLSS